MGLGFPLGPTGTKPGRAHLSSNRIRLGAGLGLGMTSPAPPGPVLNGQLVQPEVQPEAPLPPVRLC